MTTDDMRGPSIRWILAVLAVLVLAGLFVFHWATQLPASEERHNDALPLMVPPLPSTPADLDRPMTEPAEL